MATNNHRGTVDMSDTSDNKTLTEIRSDAGKVGGSKKNAKKGFGSNRELARKVGKIGGKKSKRGKEK